MKIPHPDELRAVIGRLVTDGGATVSPPIQAWCAETGIAYPVEQMKGIVAVSREFVQNSLPARDEVDLMRKAMVRAPLYRLHLDLCICRVLHAIGRGERWSRMEELLLGLFLDVSPRVLGLLDWLATRLHTSVSHLQDADFQEVDDRLQNQNGNHFAALDVELWGTGQRAAEVFPLLEQLYLPLVRQPVYFRPNAQQTPVLPIFPGENSGVLKGLRRPMSEIWRGPQPSPQATKAAPPAHAIKGPTSLASA